MKQVILVRATKNITGIYRTQKTITEPCPQTSEMNTSKVCIFWLQLPSRYSENMPKRSDYQACHGQVMIGRRRLENLLDPRWLNEKRGMTASRLITFLF
jgi:hypothetical protein